MLTYKPRFLLVVVCIFLLGSFLVRAGLPPADARSDKVLTFHASAWNFLPVVHGQVSGPAPTPTSEPPADTGDVRISKIFFDGVVPRVEADEYVQLENYDSKIVRLGGWRLHDAGQIHIYTFPAFDMDPGQVCRVYTNEYHPEWCGFNWGNGSAIWNNGGDEATLKDGSDMVIDTCSYSGSGDTQYCP